jgi:hypothetical protein
MNKDRLQVSALAAEIIGGIAVVVSLGVVAFEINQSNSQAKLNTNALEISAYQSLINSIIDQNTLIASDSDLAAIRLKTTSSPQELTRSEITRINSYYMSLIRHGDMAYFQYERGAIDQERLDSVLAILSLVLDNPVGRTRWEYAKPDFSNSYVQYLEDLNPQPDEDEFLSGYPEQNH